MRVRRLLSSAVLGLLVFAAPAVASSTQESVFMDDNRLLYRGNGVTDETLRELKALGVDRVRVSLPWRAIAPGENDAHRPAGLSDPRNPAQYPAEHFDNHDHLLRKARQMDMEVLVNVTGGAPLWATGTRKGRRVDQTYKPSATEFAAFVEMLGRRYSGEYQDENQGGGALPRVTAWSIWNEPNQAGHLRPQSVRSTRTKRVEPYAPRLYRRLVRAALGGFARSGHAGDTILLGETAPRGDRRRGESRHLRPGAFLRELFCLDARLRPLRGRRSSRAGCDFGRAGGFAVTGFAHHPYSVTSPPQTPDPAPDNVTLADRDRLTRLLDAAATAGRVPAGLPLWYTEYGYQTNPPDPIRGISLDDQARWNAEAEYLTARDPRVAAHTQFLLRDDEPRAAHPSSDPRHWSTYQSGITFADGGHKPAYDAYRLPLFAITPTRLWGLVRPGEDGAGQSVQLEFRPRGASAWEAVGGAVSVSDPRGAFEVDVPARGSGEWRFTWSPPQPPPPPSLLPTRPAPGPTFASIPAAV